MTQGFGGSSDNETVPGPAVRLLVVGYLLGVLAAGLIYWACSSLLLAAAVALCGGPLFVVLLAVLRPGGGVFARDLPDERGC